VSSPLRLNISVGTATGEGAALGMDNRRLVTSVGGPGWDGCNGDCDDGLITCAVMVVAVASSVLLIGQWFTSVKSKKMSHENKTGEKKKKKMLTLAALP
jgi:hypothetical protein